MKPLKQVRYIVVHTAADPREHGAYDTSIEDIRRWHTARGWEREGYHALIRRDGTVQQGRPLQYQGAHTLGLNHCSLGVCLSGHGDYEPMTDAQRESLLNLLQNWCTRYNVPAERVIGHREVNTLVDQKVLAPIYRTSKTCPGKKMSMSLIRIALRKLLALRSKNA